MSGCTCGATLKHSADCVVFWEPLPRPMVLFDIVPEEWALANHPWSAWDLLCWLP